MVIEDNWILRKKKLNLQSKNRDGVGETRGLAK